MSIGIYGDSFAETGNADYLYTKHLGHPCVVYAQGGSALYFSYKRFLETHHLHEKILFVITGANRSSYNYRHSDVWVFHCFPNYTNFINIGNEKVTFPNEWEMVKIKHALKNYFDLEMLIESNQRRDYNVAMLNHIITIRPDVKFIHAFGDQQHFIEGKVQPNHVTPLHKIHILENKKANFDNDTMYMDKRQNHIVKDSHAILKDLVKQFLDTNDRWFDYDINLFKDINVDINDLIWTDEELKKREDDNKNL